MRRHHTQQRTQQFDPSLAYRIRTDDAYKASGETREQAYRRIADAVITRLGPELDGKGPEERLDILMAHGGLTSIIKNELGSMPAPKKNKIGFPENAAWYIWSDMDAHTGRIREMVSAALSGWSAVAQ